MSSDANPLPSPALGGDATLLLVLKARTFIALFAVFVFFALAAPNFLSVANMAILAKHVALNAILAIGMTVLTVSGSLRACSTAILWQPHYLRQLPTSPVAILVGAGAGRVSHG